MALPIATLSQAITREIARVNTNLDGLPASKAKNALAQRLTQCRVDLERIDEHLVPILVPRVPIFVPKDVQNQNTFTSPNIAPYLGSRYQEVLDRVNTIAQEIESRNPDARVKKKADEDNDELFVKVDFPAVSASTINSHPSDQQSQNKKSCILM